MLTFVTTAQYRKDRRLAIRRGQNIALLDEIIQKLLEIKPLEPKHRDHALSGKFIGFRECHVSPDWLLVYKIENDTLVLTAFRTGTHVDIFG